MSISQGLCAYNNTLYAAWKGATYNDQLFYAALNGNTWSVPTQIPNAASGVGPSLAVFAGSLYSAWKGMGTDEHLYYSSFNGTGVVGTVSHQERGEQHRALARGIWGPLISRLERPKCGLSALLRNV